MVNLNGLTGKLVSNADNIGLIMGVLADPMANGRGLSGAPDWIMDRISHWKISTFTNPQYLIDFYKGNPPYIDTAKNAVKIWLAGEVLKMFGQGKWGNAAQKLAKGQIKGTLIATAAFAPALNPGGATNSNFQNAPTIGAYGY